jgi:2-C-methyl-D-erythritol 2,4-cyclodiphosphate synthase
LGAGGFPDIGVLFPNTDPALKGVDSQLILRQVVAKLAEAGWKTENVDSTVIAEAPKLAAHVPAMRRRLAESLGIDPTAVNVKATTNERLGSLGAGEGIAAYAVATIYH